jgi:hypothetical protein
MMKDEELARLSEVYPDLFDDNGCVREIAGDEIEVMETIVFDTKKSRIEEPIAPAPINLVEPVTPVAPESSESQIHAVMPTVKIDEPMSGVPLPSVVPSVPAQIVLSDKFADKLMQAFKLNRLDAEKLIAKASMFDELSKLCADNHVDQQRMNVLKKEATDYGKSGEVQELIEAEKIMETMRLIIADRTGVMAGLTKSFNDCLSVVGQTRSVTDCEKLSSLSRQMQGLSLKNDACFVTPL